MKGKATIFKTAMRSTGPFKSAIKSTGVSKLQDGRGDSSESQEENNIARLADLSSDFRNIFGKTRANGDIDLINRISTSNTAQANTNTWAGSTTAQAQTSGLLENAVAIAASSDPSSGAYKINSDVFGKIDNLEDYYGWNQPGGHGFRKPWDGGANGESPWKDFKETEVPSDSKLLGLSDSKGAKDIWNGVRARLVGSVFADDAHLNDALNGTADKKGAIDKLDGFAEAQRNVDSLSLTAAYNLSEKGIKEHGVGKIMEAYGEISNYLPEGILTKDYLAKLSSVSEGRDMVGAIQEAKNYDTRDYGGLELNETQVKDTADKLNRALFTNIADAMGVDSDKIISDLDKKGFSNHEDSMYNLNGATLLAAGLDGNLDEKVDGKNGYQRLMEQSEAKYGGNFDANMTVFLVNRAYDTDGENNTDGSAFASTEEGMTGLASLLKHKGGLTDNPYTPNEFTLAYNNSGAMKKGVISHLQAINEANQNLSGSGKNLSLKSDQKPGGGLESLKLVVRGHGGEDGSTMLNSGVVGGDGDSFGVKDSAFFKEILANAPDLKELHICYDSCYGKKSAEANAKAAEQAAKELGMNIAVVSHGSTTFGLVDSHQVADSDNGRSQIDQRADGQLAVNRKRDDHAGKTDVRYSQGKEAFMEKMSADKEANADLIARHDSTSSDSKDSSASLATGSSEPEEKKDEKQKALV